MKKSETVFCTLGPQDTCHANAVEHFLKFQNIMDYKLEFIDDFAEGAQLLIQGKVDYLVQNISHPQSMILCSKYRDSFYIVDSFIFPAKKMGILHRVGGMNKEKLGLMPATQGYIELGQWDPVFETANPHVLKGLLSGKYDYGITFINYLKAYPELELEYDFGGAVDAAWIVYGRKRVCDGNIIGIYHPDLYSR